MRRRPDRALLSLLAPLLLFIAFGAARVDAPVSLIGLLFDQAWVFAIVALAVAILGAALLFIRPVERRVAGVFAPAREPKEDEAALLRRLLGDLGRRSGIDTAKPDSAPAVRVGTSRSARPLVRNEPSAPNRKTVAVGLGIAVAPRGFRTRPVTVSTCPCC